MIKQTSRDTRALLKGSHSMLSKKWTLHVLSIITIVSTERLSQIRAEFVDNAIGISASSTNHVHTIIRADTRTQYSGRSLSNSNVVQGTYFL